MREMTPRVGKAGGGVSRPRESGRLAMRHPGHSSWCSSVVDAGGSEESDESDGRDVENVAKWRGMEVLLARMRVCVVGRDGQRQPGPGGSRAPVRVIRRHRRGAQVASAVNMWWRR